MAYLTGRSFDLVSMKIAGLLKLVISCICRGSTGDKVIMDEYLEMTCDVLIAFSISKYHKLSNTVPKITHKLGLLNAMELKAKFT